MIQRIVNNFYLRNIVVFLLFRSPDVLQDLSVYQPGDYKKILIRLMNYGFLYLYFIFHNRVLYERFLAKRRYVTYTVLFLSTMFIWRESTSYIQWLFLRLPGETMYQFRELKEYNALFWVFIYWANIVYTYIALGVYLAFKFFNERARLLQGENIQKDMELKQLNAQLNPHFLFNALNNIYSHQLRATADAKELILKLSELMRYILDSNKKQTVPLQEEIGFIENYIAFEKERLGERCVVVYKKELSDTRFQIVPLILFNLVENAFKHGTGSVSRSEITICIHENGQHLRLFVANPVTGNAGHSTGTGLDNTRRRLELIYGNRYKLDINQSAERYELTLELGNMT